MSELSTKPYLLRAIHQWCTDCGYTPYLAVAVDEKTIVPRAFVRAGEIVLNVSITATDKLQMGNELIEFQARFNGRAMDLSIPVDNVSAIYARENGHGMAFEVAKAPALPEPPSADTPTADTPSADTPSVPEPVASTTPQDAESSDSSGNRPRLAVAGPSARRRLSAVPDAGENHHPADPETPVDPAMGDGPDARPDNRGGPPAKPRGKPTLTRIK